MCIKLLSKPLNPRAHPWAPHPKPPPCLLLPLPPLPPPPPPPPPRDYMLKFLDEYCKAYHLEYDFFYLPMDFRKKDNLGYAFVNFTSPFSALTFKDALQDFKWQTVYDSGRPMSSKKICDVTWGRIQGQKALIEKFKDSRFKCDNPEFLPVVFNPPRNGSNASWSCLANLGSIEGLH
ncbi:MEI2 C-terminal RRM only like 1 [Striga hermonthica]|uniref:MEI2 C-terminal RRM only like 1 n=1 Tax=Striga hermonthica TaxID=68872 RepID=A0A9N7N6H7_STRHE|nr:MEI2 C-terminal RRM only like 1 [Striga hermonthica]